MVENKITEYTRQDIVDLLTSGYYDKKNDKEFLRFILEIFNPAVRDESKNWEEALEKINEFLKRDGFEIYESDNISGRQIFQYRRYSEISSK